MAVFSADHTRGELYNAEARERSWRDGGLGSLTMFPTDQILLARLLADRDGCFLHSGGLVIDGQGLPLRRATPTPASRRPWSCVRERARRARRDPLRRPQHRAPLAAGLRRRPARLLRARHLEPRRRARRLVGRRAAARHPLPASRSADNEIVPLDRPQAIWQRLLATLIRPMVTADWWDKELDVLERIVDEVPCYTMRFDKSGAIVPELERLAAVSERRPRAVSDYVRRVPAGSAPSPRASASLDIELTERCDNDCIHCCINLPAGDAAARAREMTTAQVEDVLRQAADLGCLQVRFTGGEPLLRPDFEELYLFARRLGLDGAHLHQRAADHAGPGRPAGARAAAASSWRSRSTACTASPTRPSRACPAPSPSSAAGWTCCSSARSRSWSRARCCRPTAARWTSSRPGRRPSRG